MSNNQNPTSTRAAKRRARLAKGACVLLATGALVGAGAGVASAADYPRSEQVYFTEVIKPSDSIALPRMQCFSGWLEDVNYSPGRTVLNGVEVREPGSVGVTASKAILAAGGDDSHFGVIGFADNYIAAAATNWNPFASAELTVELHCTNDWNKAVKQLRIPGYNPEVG
ncbi:hypothetical protein GCM10009836_29580 [Pseudonocardia ailaonensis]|uniref:Secreted protein n=1 Tax=Pseudonocardia ailaonensis TaxID=367279 RepID=A0ABN2N428_9PSEU